MQIERDGPIVIKRHRTGVSNYNLSYVDKDGLALGSREVQLGVGEPEEEEGENKGLIIIPGQHFPGPVYEHEHEQHHKLLLATTYSYWIFIIQHIR